MTPDEIEKRTIKAFVVSIRQERYLQGLTNPKRRAKVLTRLHHQVDDIDERGRQAIPPGKQFAPEIETILRSSGAPPRCYVLSTSSKLDRCEMQLSDALDAIVGLGMGTIISCIPGKLGYYESEEPGFRFILKREAG